MVKSYRALNVRKQASAEGEGPHHFSLELRCERSREESASGIMQFPFRRLTPSYITLVLRQVQLTLSMKGRTPFLQCTAECPAFPWEPCSAVCMALELFAPER